MAEAEEAKAGRLQKRREKARIKRERSGDTPEAVAERVKAKAAKEYDAEDLKKLGFSPGVPGGGAG
jgi:hypothetical protein